MRHAVTDLGAFGVVEPIHRTDEVARDAPDALEQTCVDQCRHGLAVLLDQYAVAAVLHDVEHLAQVLAERDGAGFGDQCFAPMIVMIVILLVRPQGILGRKQRIG